MEPGPKDDGLPGAGAMTTTTTTTTNATMSGAEIVDLCRKHTIFEWSPQGAVDPIPVARAKGVYFWTPEGRPTSTSTAS